MEWAASGVDGERNGRRVEWTASGMDGSQWARETRGERYAWWTQVRDVGRETVMGA